MFLTNIESLHNPKLNTALQISMWVQREEITTLVYCMNRSGAHWKF